MPVAARFHELRDRTLAVVDDKFAEPVRLSFMKDGKSDPVRGQIEIEAVLRTATTGENNIDGGKSREWKSQIAAGKAKLYIDRSTYTGPALVRGDAVRALSRVGTPAFEVLFVNDRSHTRLVVELGEK
jgi:hypothetical protein